MKGWIIYTDSSNRVKPEKYELDRFIEEAKKEKIKITVIQPEQVDLTVSRENNGKVLLKGELVPLPNFVLSMMGAGTTYFALAVMRQLVRLGVFVVNTPRCVEITKDKLHTHQVLAAHNLPIPKTMLAKFPVDVELIEKQFHFPIIVKTISGSQGSGVFLSGNKRNFKDLMMLLDASNSTIDIILQEYIVDSKGRDLRIITIGEKVVACMQRHGQVGEFKANYSNGGTVSKYELTPEIKQLSLQVSRALGLNVAGIDLLFGKDYFYICEASSAPGFEGVEKCCNINIPKEIFKFIRSKLKLPNRPSLK